TLVVLAAAACGQAGTPATQSAELPGIRCTDTISGSVVAALTGTGQGDFTFQASRRAPGFAEFDHIVAGFQLIRGAS
ncbi:MAG TPA: hypothetical protein VNW94_15195, partial [Streptosporangiaceae bacterium]|nr:hypothetical protein [Streptosporangiaceae bacterium]